MQHRYHFTAVAAAALTLVAATLYAVTTPALAAPSALGTPAALRIQTDPYAPNQLCGARGAVVAASDRVVLAASPTPLGRYPGLRATFELSTSDGETLIVRTSPILPSGRVLALTVEPGTLSPGAYRFRLRAERDNTVSDWTPWCGFTVND
jgi:hypothetical protein